MAFTYDVSADAGRVRMLIADRDIENAIFQDDEIDAYLALAGNSVFRAAAQALETIASNEVLVQKRIKTLSLQTDGPACAKELRQLAASLRARDNEGDATFAGFDIAEQVYSPFGEDERWLKQALREQL